MGYDTLTSSNIFYTAGTGEAFSTASSASYTITADSPDTPISVRYEGDWIINELRASDGDFRVIPQDIRVRPDPPTVTLDPEEDIWEAILNVRQPYDLDVWRDAVNVAKKIGAFRLRNEIDPVEEDFETGELSGFLDEIPVKEG